MLSVFGWIRVSASYGVVAVCLLICRHKTRLHIGQLVKDTSAKLKQASEIDHQSSVNVSLTSIACAKQVNGLVELFMINFCNA